MLMVFSTFPGAVNANRDGMTIEEQMMLRRYYRESTRIIRDLRGSGVITPEMADELQKHVDQWYEIARDAGDSDYKDLTRIIDEMLQDQDHISPGQLRQIDSILKKPSDYVVVTGIRIDKSNLVLPIGHEETITAIVFPADATNKGVYWRTEDPLIVSVEAEGRTAKVTAHSPGSVKITAVTSEGNYRIHCHVEAIVLVSSLAIEPNQLELYTGESSELRAIVEPSDASDKSIKWLSTNPTVASVDNTGIVKALKKGESRIIARFIQDETIAAYTTVNVIEESATQVSDNFLLERLNEPAILLSISIVSAVILIFSILLFFLKVRNKRAF